MSEFAFVILFIICLVVFLTLAFVIVRKRLCFPSREKWEGAYAKVIHDMGLTDHEGRYFSRKAMATLPLGYLLKYQWLVKVGKREGWLDELGFIVYSDD